MHLKLDDEIYRLENRIASRKGQLTYVSRATGRRALRSLASPVTLAAAAAVGFAAGGGIGRRRHNGANGHERAEKAGARGLAGLLATGAMWFVRAQYGSPAGFARAMIEKFSRRQ
jgi:hypothetical protein